MAPHSPQSPTSDLFRPRLNEQISLKYPLVRLTGLIDWDESTAALPGTSGPAVAARRSRPGWSPGCCILQHAVDASDEAVLGTWVQNPYWQFFTGEVYLHTNAPIDPSSLTRLRMTRWRKCIGAGIMRSS